MGETTIRTDLENGCYSLFYPSKKVIYYFDASGRLHHESASAVQYLDEPGYEVWFLHGVKHRLDGPAVRQADGYFQYWINGRCLKGISNMREFEVWKKFKYFL